MRKYEQYITHLRRLKDLENAIAVLNWDKEVNLPPKGARFRSQQMATLIGMAHQLFTAPEFMDNVEQLHGDGIDLTPDEKRNIVLSWKDIERIRKLDTPFVMRYSELVSTAYQSWLEAREADDFHLFRDQLERLVAATREKAAMLGYEDHPYDALMEEFETGLRCKDLDVLFREVEGELAGFVQAIRQKPAIDDHFLRQYYPKQKQWDFGLELLNAIGYDFKAGRQDISPHPFTINFSPEDVRITTRVDEQNIAQMIWSCIHEAGHALYEQGLPTEAYGAPIGRFSSLGIHESQSRLWENNVGRGLPFWQAHFGRLQAHFPDQLGSVSLQQFYRAINRIEPSPIRTESDELHYHFHILIRYEIEKSLIDGSLAVKDLRDAWNDYYQTYLGLTPSGDREGVLQDIHWAHGSFGYFPTYSLGSFYAAQFYAHAVSDIPGLENRIAAGDTLPLLHWLRERIHFQGRRYDAGELCRQITGEPLRLKYFLDYAKRKFGEIYGL